MAFVIYGEALPNLGYPPDLFDERTAEIVSATSTEIRVVDGDGATIVVTGTGIEVSSTGIVGGRLTSFVQTDASGALVFQVTGADLDAAAVENAASRNLEIWALLRGDDEVTGSSGRDVVVGGAGDDTLSGGAGSDWIVGMAGRDIMAGGADADVFVFGYALRGKNTGTDVVTDFQDTGAATDDLIFIRQRDYANLVITQEGDDVRLDFGRADLIIENALVEDFGRDDFTFRSPIL